MIKKLELEVKSFGHYTNTYLIYNENKEAVIVDPADKAEITITEIEKLELKPKYVLLTHGHVDHVLALEEIVKKYNIKVIANIHEKVLLVRNVSNCSNVFGLQQKKYNLEDFILLNNEEYISVGDMKIQMIHTPGHTKGSTCYYIEKENILITGDTLFSDCFGRCDLPTSNLDDMINSLIKLYKNFKEVQIYPGHENSGMKVIDTYPIVRRYLKYTSMIDLDDFVNN